MTGLRRTHLAQVVSLLALCATGAPGAGALDGPRPPDPAFAEQAEPRIEWKETWEATYESNRKRWSQELETVTKDRRERELLLSLRLAKLLDALADRLPSDGPKRVASCTEIARRLAEVGGRSRANHALRRIVDSHPGSPDLVASALDAILAGTRDRWRDTQDGEEWVEYAATRLIALQRAGHMPDAHPSVQMAWRALSELAYENGRFWEAAQALARVEPSADRERWREVREAELLAAAGRQDDALMLLNGLADDARHGRASDLLRALERERGADDPEFPRRTNLETQWELIRTSGDDPAPATLHGLIAECLKSDATAPWARGVYTSLWASVDRELRSRAGPAVTGLRQIQQGEAARRVAEVRRSGDPQALVGLYRRYPWSAAVHAALATSAEAALRRGDTGLACRGFQDVLQHAADPALRAKAQIGLRLAAASDAKEPQEGASFPDIRAQAVVCPPLPPWPAERPAQVGREVADLLPEPQACLRAVGEKLLVAGPNLLACYGADLAAPLWWRTPTSAGDATDEERRRRQRAPVPGAFTLAVAGRRIFTRWGADPSGLLSPDIAAFDVETGELVWTTAGQPWWGDLLPIASPAVADGRVYVLAVRDNPSSVVPVWLVCLDARDGGLVWQRFLASCHAGLLRSPNGPHQEAEALDLAHFAGAALAHRGAVYCVSNLGFVARCDARDGLVEWLHTYPRVRLGGNLRDVLRRQGTTPLLVGESLVCAPRDYAGAFAIERESGKLLWEQPFVPSHELVGSVGDAVLAKDDRHVVALDGASGRLLWDRAFADGVEPGGELAGAACRVRSGGRLYTLSAETGETLARSDLPTKEPIRAVALRGGVPVVLTDRLAGSRTRGAEAPPAAPATGPLDLPLRRAWSLRRDEATLRVPPPATKMADRLYLFSDGAVECVQRDAKGTVHWRRSVTGGLRDVLWAGDAMLLAYPRQVTAIHALTGEWQWAAAVPFDAREWRVCGELLFVARPKQGREAAMIRLATGEILWQRDLSDLPAHGQATLDASAWDGQHLHLLSSKFSYRNDGPADLLVRPTDGCIVAVRPFPRDGEPWPVQMVFGDGSGFFVSRAKVLCEYALSDGAVRPHVADLNHLDPGRIERLAISGDWLQVLWSRSYDAEPAKHWVLRRGDPGFILRRKGWGTVRGDVLYDSPENSDELAATNLRTGGSVAYRLPGASGASQRREVVDFAEQGGRLVVVSSVQTGRAPAVRVDAFHAASGEHQQGQVLHGLDGRGNQVAWADGALMVTDSAGLHCFVPEPAGDGKPQPVQVVHCLTGGEKGTELRGHGDTDGAVFVAHDGKSLYVTARTRNPQARPWAAGGGAGDWLELGLTTNLGAFRWAVGLDAAGRVRVSGAGRAGVPEGASATAEHDPATGRFTWSLVLPFKSIFRPWDEWRRIGLWAVAWDDRPDEGGLARRFECGVAQPGEELPPAAPAALFLDDRTREEEAALATLIHELPELPSSLELFKRDCRAGSASPADLAERYWEFIQRHPQAEAAERLLLEIARGLKLGDADPRSQPFLQRAEKAGVPDAVRRRLERTLSSCLSQWVWIDPGEGPRSVFVELNSNEGRDEWGHRAYWGKPALNWIVPPCGMGELSDLPRGKWHELRVPLYLIDMHDKPLCGINFCQQGPPRVVWDRSAVVAGGKEQVFLDDEPPKGTTQRTWEWPTEPRHSGANAHTHAPPDAQTDIRAHTLAELDEPVVFHAVPPLDRPYLSQWVFLDSASRPRTLSLDLHDGRGWAFRALWGERVRQGRYMGPLPTAGEWVELKVPLAWTPFLTRPVAGVGFGHLGGRVYWDQTAIVAGGKETLLVDGALPARGQAQGPAPTRRDWRSWADGLGRGTRPVPGKVGVGMACDGVSGCLTVPHTPELDPPQFTVEAWVYLDSFAHGAETKQWIVNKNGHAYLDGYVGLVIYRDKVAADMNIGGGKGGRFEAWSPAGALKLKQWQHLAMTYDGVMLRLYCDGERMDEVAVHRERKPGRGPITIGRWAFGDIFLEGALDEVRLYRRALSAEEVKARHANPAVTSPEAASAVAGYWGFDADAAPEEPLAEWQWVAEPSRGGRKAHTNLPASGYAGHALSVLKEPAGQHVAMDRARAASLLREQLPRLGRTKEAWAFLDDWLDLELPDPQRRVELCSWFLATFPGHPKTANVLGWLADSFGQMGEPDAAGRAVAVAREQGVTLDALYAFHRHVMHVPREFVGAWQIIGPFPGHEAGGGLETQHPPEVEGVKLGKAYHGATGEVGWRPAAADDGCVNLKGAFGALENAVAYAATWVHSDREQRVAVVAGGDDRCKVWLNGKQALAGPNSGYVSAGDLVAPATLAAGWNEVLVKVSQTTGEWGFYFELLDETARWTPDGTRFQPSPPAK